MWQPDIFAKPKARPPKDKKKFDAVEILKGLRMLTSTDKDDFYISEMLGQLVKNGFIPKLDLSHGWGSLDGDELSKLITWARAKMALIEKQRVRASVSSPPMQTLLQTQAIKGEAAQQSGYFAKQAKKLDLTNIRWAQTMD